jgi:hypothetical protein
VALTDKLDRKYTVTTPVPKNIVTNTLKDRVEEANRERSWFSFKNIDYRKIKVDDYRAVIRYNPVFFGSPGGFGFIILRFAGDGISTTILADVKLIKWQFWFLIAPLVLLSVLSTWILKGMEKVAWLTFLWAIFLGIGYINVVIHQYRLKRYLVTVLASVGIEEELVRVK